LNIPKSTIGIKNITSTTQISKRTKSNSATRTLLEENVLIFYYISVQSSELSTPTSSEKVVYQTIQNNLASSISSGTFTTVMTDQAKSLNNSVLSAVTVSLSDFSISPVYTTSIIHSPYPTYLPSSRPSTTPSCKPSAIPSAKPTFSLLSYWKYKLVNELSVMYNSNEKSLMDIYQELVVNKNIIYGDIKDWNIYVFQHVARSLSSEKKTKSIDAILGSLSWANIKRFFGTLLNCFVSLVEQK
jgi:hypothetical protein